MSTQFSLPDPDFRPRSYFWPISVEQHLLATIKGQQRRMQAPEIWKPFSTAMSSMVTTHRISYNRHRSSIPISKPRFAH